MTGKTRLSDRRRGLTLTEVIAVVAIALILASIAYPVFSRARDRSQEARCISNFRQIYTALSLYRQDWGGTDAPAPSAEMGFPGWAYRAIMGDQAAESVVHAAWWTCHGRAPFAGGHAAYWQMWAPVKGMMGSGRVYDSEWIAHVERAGDGAVIFADPNHQLTSPTNSFTVQKVLGMHLGGSVSFRIRRGSFIRYTWWERS